MPINNANNNKKLTLSKSQWTKCSLESLGIDSANLAEIKSTIINSENGLPLVMGNVNCGMNTTVSSILASIKKSNASKKVTLEEPIEFNVDVQEAEQVLRGGYLGHALMTTLHIDESTLTVKKLLNKSNK